MWIIRRSQLNMIRLLSPTLVRQVSKSTVQQQNRSFSFLKKLGQFKTDKSENDAYSSFVGRRIRDPNDQLVLEQDLTPEQQERLEILRRERTKEERVQQAIAHAKRGADHYNYGKSRSKNVKNKISLNLGTKIIWKNEEIGREIIFLSFNDAAKKLGRTSKTLKQYAERNLHGFRFLDPESEEDRQLLQERIREIQTNDAALPDRANRRPSNDPTAVRLIREVNGKIDVFKSFRHAGMVFRRSGKTIKNYCDRGICGFRILDLSDPKDALIWEKARLQNEIDLEKDPYAEYDSDKDN